MAQMARAQRGLYGGKTKQYGNQISHSNRHSRRTWSPNVQTKSVWSDALERKIKVRLSSLLKTRTKNKQNKQNADSDDDVGVEDD